MGHDSTVHDADDLPRLESDEPKRGTAIIPAERGQTVWSEDEIEEFEGVDTGDGDWFGIRTDPWPCPACGATFEWVTGAHFVIVAPSKDDLLMIAAKCKEIGRNPRIVAYDDGLPAMSIFQWHALGRPVHGMRKPAGA
jgi:hypothetical protein